MVRLTGTAGLGRPGATRPRPGAGSLEAGHLCGADPGGLPVGGGAPGPAAGPHGRACARLSPGVRTTKPRRWERGGGDVGGTLGRSRCAGDARRLRCAQRCASPFPPKPRFSSSCSFLGMLVSYCEDARLLLVTRPDARVSLSSSFPLSCLSINNHHPRHTDRHTGVHPDCCILLIPVSFLFFSFHANMPHSWSLSISRLSVNIC